MIPALFPGIRVGTALTCRAVAGIWYGIFDTFTRYMVDALNDRAHVAVNMFSLMTGGLVGIISNNGGTRGIVNSIIGLASTPKRGQLVTELLLLLIKTAMDARAHLREHARSESGVGVREPGIA